MMLETYKTGIANQFEAAFCTLKICLDRCPDSCWNATVAKAPFCQVMFHTLFFTDYYLGEKDDDLRDQPFHREHRDFFADYEQLQDREPTSLYDRTSINAYLQHCRDKARAAIDAETTESLAARTGFQRRDFSRAELYVYNMRHVYHHAAQLTLRLRLDTEVDIPWIDSGWQDIG
jgi:hypothetical protein